MSTTKNAKKTRPGSSKTISVRAISVKAKSVKTNSGAATRPEKQSGKPASTKAVAQVKVLSSKRSFHGSVFDVYSDNIVEPGGQPHVKDVIRHHGSAVILPVQYVDADGRRLAEPHVLLERQYRHATGKYLWEIPAGRLEPGESPLGAAKRELAEETGFRAKRWSKLTSYYASPGFLAEKMNMFLAEELTPGETNLDADEIISWRFFPLSEVLALMDANKLEDSKTMLSVLLYLRKGNLAAAGATAGIQKKSSGK